MASHFLSPARPFDTDQVFQFQTQSLDSKGLQDNRVRRQVRVSATTHNFAQQIDVAKEVVSVKLSPCKIVSASQRKGSPTGAPRR